MIQEPKYLQYAHDVLDGRVVAGELVKLACARFLRFLKDPRYEFRPEAVDRVVRFIRHLRHTTGQQHGGKPFILEPWQEFMVASVFGFFHKDDGTRLTRSVYVQIARKCGKTALSAAIACYGLIADREPSAEVDLVANSREQAQVAFTFCSNYARGLNPSGNRLKIYRNKIEFPEMLSKLTLYASDSSKMDGHNSHMALIDELHASQDGGRMRDVLASSMAMRENPLLIIITTAGFDKSGPCYATRTVCTEILRGLKEDDSQFALIYELDEGDDWTDESVWKKANPNLDITVRRKFLREQVLKARNNPIEEVGIKTKNFNLWCDAEFVWIPDTYILQASADLNIKDFAGCDCWVGVDLASVNDFTAVSFMFPREDKLYFINRYYLPESALRESRLSVIYGDWRRRGLLRITPGNVTDYDFIQNDIMDVGKIANIQSVSYDPYNATQFTINCEEAGLPMEPCSQSLGNFNRPTTEFTRLCYGGRVVIDNNDITRFCLRNVALKRDHNGNAKPSKAYGDPTKKIDGVISMLEALNGYLSSPRYGEFY